MKGKLVQRMDDLGIRHASYSTSKVAAQRALTVRTPKRNGIIGRISYSIPRHMIFVHKGVGRGTKISQVGNTNRKPKPWFNPVVDANIDKLADTVAEELGTEIINKMLIK